MGVNVLVSIFLCGAVFIGSVKAESPVFIVQAAIDSARIIGLPAMPAVVAQNKKMQELSLLEKEQGLANHILSWRRVFFRKYFS